MSTNVVQLQHLTKQYSNSSKPAVSDISLDIPEGSVFGLLGPNGAGKSTTVMILCGLLRPDSGSVSVMGLQMPEHGAAVRKKNWCSPSGNSVIPQPYGL